mmetsp:Transcript_61722/g.200046  ORF Transcript_61722/g.200046 Transcript_61722/m.200046 type:complete len:244 (+) Transcript_61722:1013-1744(+)
MHRERLLGSPACAWATSATRATSGAPLGSAGRTAVGRWPPAAGRARWLAVGRWRCGSASTWVRTGRRPCNFAIRTLSRTALQDRSYASIARPGFAGDPSPSVCGASRSRTAATEAAGRCRTLARLSSPPAAAVAGRRGRSAGAGSARTAGSSTAAPCPAWSARGHGARSSPAVARTLRRVCLAWSPSATLACTTTSASRGPRSCCRTAASPRSSFASRSGSDVACYCWRCSTLVWPSVRRVTE